MKILGINKTFGTENSKHDFEKELIKQYGDLCDFNGFDIYATIYKGDKNSLFGGKDYFSHVSVDHENKILHVIMYITY